MLGRLATYTLLIIGAVISLFPFYWMIVSSFKPGWEILSFPPTMFPREFTFEHYRYVAQVIPVLRVIANSAIVSSGTVALNVLIASLVAYALTKLRFPGRELLFLVTLALMMLPFQLLLVPLFLLVHQYGLHDTYWAMILPGAVNSFSIFLLRQAFLSVPNDYIEAARIDGASHLLILFRIVMPMVVPMILTVAVINFYWTWNDFLWPHIVISREEMATLQVALARFQGFQSQRWGPIMAASVITSMPILVMYLFVQRKFIESLSMSGMKG